MQQGKLPTLRLLDFARMIGRRWPVVIVTMGLCMVLGMALGVVAPKTYTATASLTVSPITTNPFSSAAVNQQINITTERAILSSGEVAAIAAKQLGEAVSPGSLQQNAETAAPSGSQILEVSITLPDPQKAANQANALANAYLQFRSQGAAEVAAGYIKQLDARIKGLNSQPSLADGQVQQLQDLLQQRTSLTLASASPGRIIGIAKPPTAQSSMGVLVFMTAGTVGGLLLGLALALLWERMDPKVRTASRMAVLFPNDLVELTGEHQESLRWLVRTVRQRGARDGRGATIFVGIVSLPGSDPVGLATRLSRLTRAHQLDALSVWGTGISSKAIDLGWPERESVGKWKNHDVVYVEIDESLSGTRLADLADRMDILFLAAGKKTPLQRIKSTQALISSMPSPRVTPIYCLPRRRLQKKHNLARSSAAGTPGWDEDQDLELSVVEGFGREKVVLPRIQPEVGTSRSTNSEERKSHAAPVPDRSVLVPHRVKKGA
ncbi:hypothetical protein [Arthrobacter psychrochitiniphilus]|uniref:hypothetical protein n=1 Tax=Arthrobacter psychrochitiniphilus TaxID=291045 RepID=UPI003F7B9765